jgi:hypothetical protein
MAYPISDVTRRVVYTGSAGVGPYSFTFEVLANTDIQVYKNTTLLTLTTNYTVTINANGTGSVTLVVAATGADTITIVGDRAIQRATDFVTGGDLFANTLNDEFDSLVIFAQQVDEKADRGLKAPVTDPTDVNMVLPVKATRKGTVLAFDSTTGDPVAGPALDAVTTVIAQSANINTVATNIASVNTVAGNNTNVTTVAGVSSAVTTVAGISANVTSVAGNSSNINTVAGNNANVTTVAGISGNVTTVAGISANVTSVAGNSTNINAVAGNSTNINAVNANKTNIDTVAGVSSNVTTVATNITAVNSAYTNIAAIIDAPNQATAAAASATAAAASAAAGMYSAVQDKSANYTVVAGDAGDLIRVTTTSGAITITLPTISTVGDGFKVAIVKWTGDGNAVSVVRSSTNTINGATSASIGSQYSSTTFVADLETGQWFAASTGLGASNVAVDVFSGNGSTTAFTLSGDPGSKNNTLVEISGVYQQKSTYTVSGTTLTFSTAPPTGTSNIEVVWTAPLAIGTPSDGTVTTAKIASSVTLTTPTIDTITSAAATALTLKSAGTTAVTIDTSQNVGIGTTSPTDNGGYGKIVDIYGSTGGALYLHTSTATNYAFLGKYNSSTQLADSGSAGLTFATASGSTPSERMRIDSSGNVGIGTTSPTSQNGKVLQIDGGASAADLRLTNTATGSAKDNGTLLGISGSDTYLYNFENAFMAFGTNATERMRIASNGYFRYGVNVSDSSFFRVENPNNSSGAINFVSVMGSNANNTNSYHFIGVTGSSDKMYVLGNGNLQNVNNSYGTLSDIKLKENIVDATPKLADIMRLQVRNFNLKSEPDHKQIGFVAQEIEQVFPSIIEEISDLDENRNLKGTTTKGVKTSILVPMLVKAIQEQQALITAQAETINALTARIVALEAK